jgi:hypothetical protein
LPLARVPLARVPLPLARVPLPLARVPLPLARVPLPLARVPLPGLWLDALARRLIRAASSLISASVGASVMTAVTRNASVLMPRMSGSRNAVALAPPPPMACIPPPGGAVVTRMAAMPV